MKSSNNLCLLFAFLLLMTGCRKDEITITSDEELLPGTENVTFQFLIINASGMPIEDSQILINSDAYQTDKNGVAITKPYDIPSLGLRSEIFATGFISIVKLIGGANNSKKQEKVILIKSITTIISTGSIGEIDGGGFLTLPSNLILSDGSVYTGDVFVKNGYLNPDRRGFLLSAPGNMVAINTANEYQQLASLGMYMIELYDADGNELKIPEGSTATIYFPISDQHKDITESEIPLWYFEEDSGLWIEDGKAKVVENMMIAEVSHFTWWNCDLPYNFIETCMAFLSNEGDVIPGLDVKFSIGGVTFGHAITDANGFIQAKVPVDVKFDLKFCLDGEEVGSQTTGPYEDNGRKIYVNTSISFLSISGIAINCDGLPLSNGYAFFEGNDGLVIVPLSADGSFKYASTGNDHILQFFDIDTGIFIDMMILGSIQVEDIDLEEIKVCGQEIPTAVSGYVLLDSDGDNIGDTPLENASISLFNTLHETESFTTTDENGYYEVILLPEILYTLEYVTDGSFVGISAGDKSPDEDVPDEGFLYGLKGYVEVVIDEHDSNNDFVVIPVGQGTISGIVMGDQDDDGFSTFPLEWSVLINNCCDGKVDTILINSDGSYSIAVPAGYSYINSYISQFMFSNVSWDETPDPEGGFDDSGSSHKINVVVQDGEIDADNNYKHSYSKVRAIICRVLEDTNFDGVGDVPVENIKVNLYNRGSGIIGFSNNTDQFGVFRNFTQSDNETETLEKTLELETSEYEIIDIIDTSQDGDPLILDGNITKMEIDIAPGEWDSGNIFVVRKK